MKKMCYILMASFLILSLLNGIRGDFDIAVWLSSLGCFAAIFTTILEDDHYAS